MEEEIKMQIEWREDEKKCTFIILARDLIDGGNSDVPPSPKEKDLGEGEKESYPQLVEQTMDAMIGDVNLFLSEEEIDESDEERLQTTNRTDQSTTPELNQAELDLMIAAASHRHKNLGTELALMMMHYGAKHLQIKRFFVKINESNSSSLKLFKEKLGFEQCAYVKCFGEYELEVKCDSAKEMVLWVERRWELWCRENDTTDSAVSPCRELYEIHECPLNSSP